MKGKEVLTILRKKVWVRGIVNTLNKPKIFFPHLSGEGWGLLDFMSAGLPSSSSFLRRTSTASSRSQCSPPHPNSSLWIKAAIPDCSVPRQLQQQPLDQSVPCRTYTTSSGSECSPPDLKHKESPKICQKECQKICQIHMPERMSDRKSEFVCIYILYI